MKRLVVVLLLVLSIPTAASHIVGGEITMVRLTRGTYQVSLIYYFDVANNPGRDPRLEEPSILVGIFRKKGNVLVQTLVLNWAFKSRVPYTQPDCSSGELITDKITYQSNINFPEADYSDPEGYYITWARCCRNYSILNIISQDPDHGGLGAGQTFYLGFSPIFVNGQEFINSSPKDFPALNDYACPTKPYYVDFAGTDPDGDSLAYTLVTPLSTVSSTPLPPITPEPYPEVTWLTGFGIDRIVNGTPKAPEYPDLNISPAGFLRVTPRSQGLYVFAVKVDQYRDGKKIGETRRDFQMLVTDCRLSAPPEVSGKTLTATTYTANQITLNFANTVADNDRCFMVSVADPDADRAADNYTEYIRLKIVAMNFKPKAGMDLQSMLPTPSFGYIHGGGTGTGTVEFRICLPACPLIYGAAYQIGVVAFDDACSLPLTDTLKVNINVQAPNNARAQFNPPKVVSATLNEGEQDDWPFEAHDTDGDQMIFYALPNGFAPDKSGMKTTVGTNVPGLLKGDLNWDAFCDIYDFTKRTSFILQLMVDDLDQCDINPPDTLTFNLAVILPPYPKPFIDTDLTADPNEVEVTGIEKKIYDNWTFNVTARDLAANASVTMQMKGDGFNPSTYGMEFAKTTGIGTITAPFHWNLLCDKLNPEDKNEFNIGFVAIDSINKCRLRQTDSLVVKVTVLKPDNSPPVISIVNLSNGATYEDGNAVILSGQELNLQLNITDTDTAPKDNLTLKLTDFGGDINPEGFSWQNVTGPSVLIGSLLWSPQCSIFVDGDSKDIYERNYHFDFQYGDDRCYTATSDTFTINVKVKDPGGNGDFEYEPPNIFTPNGDGVNDFYAMMRRDESGALVSILPPDNCHGAFENIRIYNRWGKQVFTSGDREFKWYGLNEAAGVYFYHVVFTNREFKGTVSLRD
ncbi:MAG: gliding motility-associated C-terminal domain-containing protein [Bacteroidota bacterium]